MEPFEIVAGPLGLWLAPTATAFPLIDAAPAGPWAGVGTNRTRNYSDDGVAVTHGQTIQQVSPAGAIGPVKAFLTAEALTFTVTLWDITLEQYTLALGGLAPTTTAAGAGTAGYKKLGLSRGETIKSYALLARGRSAYGDNYAAQYQVPRCYQSGSPNPVYRKGVPAGLALEFTALEDLNAATEQERFGSIIMQHQAPLAP